MQRGSGCRTERGDYEKECHRARGHGFRACRRFGACGLLGLFGALGGCGFVRARPVRFRCRWSCWTYYNGTQQQAFEDLVKDFNATKGKDLGIVVTSSSQGGVNDLASAVTDSAQELVGSEAMPDAFLSYSDTASVIDGFGMVADLSGYLTEEEKAGFVEGFLEEGDLNGNGSLKVFPVGKSTETLQINMTDFQTFADATGTSLDEMSTIEAS